MRPAASLAGLVAFFSSVTGAGAAYFDAPARPAADAAAHLQAQQMLMRKEQRRPEGDAKQEADPSKAALVAESAALEDGEGGPHKRNKSRIAHHLRHHFLPFLNEDVVPPNGYVTCFPGGRSGPSFTQALEMQNATLFNPPMTISARIKTRALGRFQVILGWGSGKDHWDSAELRLSSTGNLQYGIHDGFAWHSVEAKPEVNLEDGNWHVVAMSRDVQGGVQLYVNGSLVGHGYIAGNPRMPLKLAKTARMMYGFDDLAFLGKVTQIFIYDRDLSWWEIHKLHRVPCRRGASLTMLNFSKATLHNNLGGLGPDTGEPAMRFRGIARYGGVPLDLVVKNTSLYQPMDPAANGKYGKGLKLARVNLKSGTSVDLRFEFFAEDSNDPIRVDNFYMTFMDIDRAHDNTSVESVSVNTDVAAFWVTQDSALRVQKPNGNLTLQFTAGALAESHWFEHTLDPDDPTDNQEQRGFALIATNTSGFEATLAATNGRGGRMISFTGWSSIVADGLNKTASNDTAPVTATKPPPKPYFGSDGSSSGEGTSAGVGV